MASLVSIDAWSGSCGQCGRPSLLHTRSEKESLEIILKIWEEFRNRTKAIVTVVKAESRKEVQDNVLLEGLKRVLHHISGQHTDSMNVLMDSLKTKNDDVVRPAKLTKPAKVPVWTKDLTLEANPSLE